MGVNVTVADQRKQKVVLSKAILIYEDGSNALATAHRVRHAEDGTAVVLAGRPVTSKATRALARSMLRRGDDGLEYLPDAVLARGNGITVWHEPRQVRHFSFDYSGPEATRVGNRSAKLPCPGVVFVAGKAKWRIFVHFDEGRPSRSTHLFRPPFFNCYADGSICNGNVRLPSRDLVDADALMRQWSEAFFWSKFTHPTNDVLTTHQHGLDGLWGDMLDGKTKGIAQQDVLDAGLTLQRLLTCL